MRFHLGAIPETPGFSADASWRSLSEPTPGVMQLFALPLGIATGVGVGLLWFLLTPLREPHFDSPGLLLVALALLIPIHELIHAVVHPRAGRSDDSILGIWPSRLLVYAHYSGELSRSRFISILLMPFLVISLVPLAACIITVQSSALLAFISIVNALSSCGDLLGVCLLLYQVPRSAKVRNQGWKTYWKEYETLAT